MGKRAKTSRKGKKAWRANINTEGIEDFYEKSNKDALDGGSLSNVVSDHPHDFFSRNLGYAHA
jgi:nucleolar protein 53